MRFRRHEFVVMLAGLLACAAAAPAVALKPEKGEETSLKTCEESVCRIILGKEAKGKDPQCDITKTWSKETIKKGESSAVSWAFGDTRCRANLKVDRGAIVAALTRDKFTLRSEPQTVKCVVEQDGKLHDLTAVAKPKLKFRNGKADKVWINLETIEGPENVAGTIRTIAAMEDKLGIFHGALIKSVNKFIHKRCAKKYGPDAKTAAAEDDEDDGDTVNKKVKSRAKSDEDETEAKPDKDREKAKSEAVKAKAAP